MIGILVTLLTIFFFGLSYGSNRDDVKAFAALIFLVNFVEDAVTGELWRTSTRLSTIDPCLVTLVVLFAVGIFGFVFSLGYFVGKRYFREATTK